MKCWNAFEILSNYNCVQKLAEKEVKNIIDVKNHLSRMMGANKDLYDKKIKFLESDTQEKDSQIETLKNSIADLGKALIKATLVASEDKKKPEIGQKLPIEENYEDDLPFEIQLPKPNSGMDNEIQQKKEEPVNSSNKSLTNPGSIIDKDIKKVSFEENLKEKKATNRDFPLRVNSSTKIIPSVGSRDVSPIGSRKRIEESNRNNKEKPKVKKNIYGQDVTKR